MKNEHQVMYAILVTASNAGLTLLYIGALHEDGCIWGGRVAVAPELTAADVAEALDGDDAEVVGRTVRDELERRGFVFHEIDVELSDEHAISRVIQFDAKTGRVRPWRLLSPLVAGPETTAMLSLMEDGILPFGHDGNEE
jgi:hypothetical protein